MDLNSLPPEINIQNLIERLPFSIIIMYINIDDPENSILTWANEIASSENSYDMNSLIGQPVSSCLPNLFNHDKHIIKHWLEAICSNKDQIIKNFDYIDINSSHKICDLFIVPLGNNYIANVYKDITAEVKYKNEIESQMNALTEINDDLEQLLYIASHDLREPLVGVAGFAHLLSNKYKESLDEKGQHFIEKILDGINRMEHKIDDLLALSRVGRAPINGIVNLQEIVDEAWASINGNAEKCKAQLNIINELHDVRADKAMITQAMQNIFSNSIKYRDESRTPVIEIRSEEQDENKIIVSVTDNGIGFEQQYEDRVFKIFQRLHSTDKYPGTGIGLALVKKIIEKYKGEVWVKSEPGIGTTVYFTLPQK